MSPVYTRSLGKGLAIVMILMMLVLWLAIVGLNGLRESRELQSQARLRLQQDLSRLQVELEHNLTAGRKVNAERLLTVWAADTRLSSLVLADESGRVMFANRMAWKGRDLEQVEPQFDSRLFSEIKHDRQPRVVLSQDRRFILGYFPLAWGRAGSQLRQPYGGLLYGRYDLSAEQSRMWREIFNSAALLALVIVVTLWILWRWLNANLITPIAHMAAVAERLGRGDHEARMEVTGKGELTRLAQTFNRAAGLIQQNNRQLSRQQAMYDTLAEANQAILRASDQDQVFQACCRIAVERAGFRLAWIGRVNGSGRQLDLVACDASEASCKDYAQSLKIPLTPSQPEGQGPAATAVRDNRPVVINDFLGDPSTRPWHRKAAQFQLGACACFPIRCCDNDPNCDRVVGVFAVYAREKGYFSQDLIDLLTELADDISFALENFERERQRREAQEALRSSERRLAVTLNSIGDAVITTDAEGRVERMNPIAERLTGWSMAEAQVRPLPEIFKIFDSKTGQAAQNPVAKVLTQGEVVGLANDTELISKDGSRRQIADSAAPIREESGEISGVVLVFRDVSDHYAMQQKLLANEARYRQLFEKSSISKLLIDEGRGEIMDANDAAARFYGYGRKELCGMPLSWIEQAEPLNEQWCGDEDGDHLRNHRLRSGQIRKVETHVGRLQIDGASLQYMTVLDVTERQQTLYFSRLLTDKIGAKVGEDFFQAMVRRLGEELGVAYVFVGVLVRSELRVETIAGWNQGQMAENFSYELAGTPCADVMNSGACIFEQRVQSLFPEDHLLVEMNVEGYAGAPLRDNSGQVSGILVICDTRPLPAFVLQILQMFSVRASAELERQKANDEIQRLAFYDPLTGLPNRRLFMDRLRQELGAADRHGKQGALMFLDLDNFKHLNDAWGHQLGDALLVQVAERLRQHLRVEDIVARLGGDEFVILLPELDSNPENSANLVRTVADKIKTHMAAVFDLEGQRYQTSTSIGITLFTGAEDPGELLKQADTAMYRAKSAGRNAIRFYLPEMQLKADARLQMEKELREALEQGQLQLFFQPQHDADGVLVGAEALLRWQHPERGWVPPADFIPIAEESGLIVPIGQWVFQEACRCMTAWVAEAFFQHLDHLAINLSPRQFHQPDFVNQVETVLSDGCINLGKVMLELTESVVIEDVADTIAKMQVLKQKGVRFSIDDFGTGYSSLTYLKKLPLDQLKIDRSFVLDIATDPNDQAIIRTILAMADQLGLAVIAEGVEDEVQRRFLLANGCTQFQGYLFCPPLPVDDFVRYANEQFKVA